MKPSVARTVHYVSYGTPGGEYQPECRAAIITDVPDPLADWQLVGLAVLNPEGMFFKRDVRADEGTPGQPVPHQCGGRSYPGGTWHWPARVED